MRKFSAIDLFAGAGGLSLGLVRSGFEITAAVEFDPVAVKTYESNIGNHIFNADLHDYPVSSLLQQAGLKVGECDLLAGGPPCQGFSIQRRGLDKDDRNDLVLQFAKYIEGVRPKIFLMENVSGLMSKRGQGVLKNLIDSVKTLGYVTHLTKVEAADFGVPQFRSRVILVGQRQDLNLPEFQFPQPIVTPSQYRTVRDAIGDLPSPPTDGKPHGTVANHSREARLSATNIERLKHIPQGGGREDLPLHLQLPCHINNPTHRHVEVYGRLHWDKPSGTITARFDSFTRGRFAHPTEHRSLTLREGARLQTFPDDFVFIGNREQGARQIGNAVPVNLAEALGGAIAKCLASSRQQKGSVRKGQKLEELTL